MKNILIQICSGCKDVVDPKSLKESSDQRKWIQIEEYFIKYHDLTFSHGMCPDCIKKYYPEFYEKINK